VRLEVGDLDARLVLRCRHVGYDESGREQQRTFESARAARDFRLIVEVADKAKRDYAGPTYTHGDIEAGIGNGGAI
jgi:hypothetical protein